MPWLVVDETYTTGRLNQKLQQMSQVFGHRIGCSSQNLVPNVAVVIHIQIKPFPNLQFGCCHYTIKGTSLGCSLGGAQAQFARLPQSPEEFVGLAFQIVLASAELFDLKKKRL